MTHFLGRNYDAALNDPLQRYGADSPVLAVGEHIKNVFILMTSTSSDINTGLRSSHL
jgi:hypothetical protein